MTAWRSGPLAVRSFRLLTAGQFASTAGDYFYAVALPWFVLSAKGGPVLLGTVLACYGVPRTVLIPVGGVLADKIGPRTLMLAADLTRCGLVIGLALLAARHVTAFAALGPVAGIIGAGEGLFIPASYTIMPSLLRADALTGGNAVFAAAQQIGSLVGPVLAGVVVAVAGPSPAFIADAASFGISAFTLALIPSRPATESVSAGSVSAGPARADSPGRTLAADLPPAGVTGLIGPAEGGAAAMLRRSRLLRGILVKVLAANLAGGGMAEVALPSLAHTSFGPSGYGILLACVAAGSVVGTLAAARSGKLRRPAVFASLMALLGSAAICVVPYLGGIAGAATALAVLGICTGLSNVIVITLLQKLTPRPLLGRVMSMVTLCAMGSFPLSVAVAGVLVGHLGAALFFPIAGGISALGGFWGLGRREWRNLGTLAGEPARTPASSAAD